MTDTEVDYVLRVSEAFGRFALHKEAAMTGSLKFSKQAQHLLHWTTRNVVPTFALSLVDNAPFADLNLSRISPEKSFESFPLSPVPTGPPRRRANRNSTPNRLDSSQPFSMPSHSQPRESCLLQARAFAVSLMQSSCVIFSEWLAVGGSGSNEIAESAVAWCKIFESQGDDTQKELLPAFTRLAIQLCKTVQDFTLLKQLVICCNETCDEEEMPPVHKALVSLVSTRGSLGPVILTNTIESVLEAAYSFTEQSNFAAVFELPSSMETVWPADKGCIVSALNAILTNKQACLELAKRLVANLVESANKSPASALFDAKCLWMLSDSSASKSAAEVAHLVRQVDTDNMNNDSDLKGVVDDLLECLA